MKSLKITEKKRVGYCGSDLNSYRGGNPLVKYPVIPGHEVSGVIEAVGKNVPDKYIQGQSVAIMPQTACGQCTSCRNNRPNACRFNQTLGVQRDGALCEYLAVPYEKLIVDSNLSFTQLALLEPLAVGFHASRRGRVKPGDKVVVLGCGVIGLGAIAGSSFFGAEVIAVDLFDNKLESARKAGAKYVINSKTSDARAEIERLTDGHGADLVIEAAGHPETYTLAIDAVSFTGRVVYIGYTSEKVAFETKYFVLKELDILGSRGSEKEDFENVLKHVRDGKIDPLAIVSHTVSFDEADKALKMWSDDPSQVTKIVVEL